MFSRPAAKEREAEPDAEVSLLNDVRDLFRWHPGKNHLWKLAHEHPLKIYHEKKTSKKVNCHICSLPIEKNATYGCSECKDFLLHKVCAEFPDSVKHRCHKDPLKLVQHTTRNPPITLGRDMSKKKCSACDLPLRDTTTYACKECDVYLHKFCMELPDKIKHFSHAAHLLALDYDALVGGTDFHCSVCKKSHMGLNYHCRSCDFTLGLQCITKEAERPNGTQAHILTLCCQPEDQLEGQCLACDEIFHDSEVVFRCEDCNFGLHFGCVMDPNTNYLPPTAKVKTHEHALTFYKSREDDSADSARAECDVCHEKIDNNWPLYHCSDCCYDAHLHCALPDYATELPAEQPPKISELPPSVKISSHGHHLEIADSSENFYRNYFYFNCDICEYEGYSELPLYTCDDCECYVHLTCMLHKLKISFAHKLDYVLLDTSPVLINNPSPTVCEIIESLKDNEKNELGNIFKAAMSETLGGATNEPRSQEQQQDNTVNDTQVISNSNSDGDEPFSQIKSSLERKCKDPESALEYFETRSQVDLKDKHIISKNLSPVLGKLIHKYGDFSNESLLTKKGKTYIFMLLCAALYSICITREEQLSETQLFTCWDCFKIAKHARFKVDFAFKRLSKAMYAYFDIRDLPSASEDLRQLDSEMMMLKEKMVDLREGHEKRMTSLLYDPMDRSKTMEILGKKSDSWDEYRKFVDLEDSEMEDDEPETKSQSPESGAIAGEGLSGNPNIASTASMNLADGAENVGEKIESFVMNAPSKRSLSYFASKYYSQTRKKKDILCFNCHAIIQDPTQGCKNCSNSNEQPPDRILSDFHSHPLHIYNENNTEKYTSSTKSHKMDKHERLCVACGFVVSYPAYRCAKCNIFLHVFCIQLPEEIYHPLHPAHALSLEANSERLKEITCNACGEKCFNSWFVCKECNFCLEIPCLLRIPTVQSESHEKFLLFPVKKLTDDQGCLTCGGKITNPPYMRCAPCNLSLHVQCADLPSTIKYACDEHPLTLITDSRSQTADHGIEDSQCYVCGKKRNHQLPIYYCRKCKRAVHIECVTLPPTSNQKACTSETVNINEMLLLFNN